jgi:hypothetical protein
MEESYSGRRRSCSPFVVTSYVAGADGELIAELPACCPVGGADGGGECRVVQHHRRTRKSGPQHSLCVATCRAHGTAFTLYPPGYAPYRRQPVLRSSPTGEELGCEECSRLGSFSGTLFDAAMDASEGRRWARDSEESLPERWWSTQGRHLRLAAAVVGVAAELGTRVRESVATVLSVGTLFLRDRSKGRGYRAIGKAVCEVLEELRGCERRAMQLLTAGHVIGHWGEPLHWDSARGVLERSPFCAGGTVGSG